MKIRYGDSRNVNNAINIKKAGCKFYSQKVAQSVKQEPKDFSSVKLSETQKKFCDSFDRNADYLNKQELR